MNTVELLRAARARLTTQWTRVEYANDYRREAITRCCIVGALNIEANRESAAADLYGVTLEAGSLIASCLPEGVPEGRDAERRIVAYNDKVAEGVEDVLAVMDCAIAKASA